MEPAAGIEPANLILTKDVLYQLSYTGINLKCQRTRWQGRQESNPQ